MDNVVYPRVDNSHRSLSDMNDCKYDFHMARVYHISVKQFALCNINKGWTLYHMAHS